MEKHTLPAGFNRVKRQALSLRGESLVAVSIADEARPLPLIVEARVPGLRLSEWATAQREQLTEYLRRHGAVLFRGFSVGGAGEFEEAVKATSGAAELVEYSYRSSPRTQVSGRIYTSTDYPPEHTIPLHNEMAYSRQWPMKVYFYCAEAAREGGETPLADSRRVYARISAPVRARFEEKGVLYVRNYSNELDLSWQNVFQTESKSEVEDYCRHEGIEVEWKADGRLRTSQLCQSVARHPHTGEMVWFNQAHLFHLSTLEATVRDMLLSEFAEQDLPRNSYYGDGTPIETSALDEIHEAYRQESVIFPWHKGDLLMLDNMLVAHGRRPYAGARRILVGMAEPFNRQTLSANS
jgi:alpha-ketoglutarate-dependent taurine dioxygenase